MPEIDPKLRKYIETEILTKYVDGAGHSLDHIKYVIKRSLKFAEQVPGTDKNMCYVIAAYHDLGRLLDDHYHEKISAFFLRIDESLKSFFNEEQIEIMAEAVEDHRASSDHEPRSVYGRIVSSADRTTSVNAAVTRPADSYISRYPNRPIDDNIETARQHLYRKYGPDGYGRDKIYFKDPDFEKFLKEIVKIASDEKVYRDHYKKLKNML